MHVLGVISPDIADDEISRSHNALRNCTTSNSILACQNPRPFACAKAPQPPTPNRHRLYKMTRVTWPRPGIYVNKHFALLMLTNSCSYKYLILAQIYVCMSMKHSSAYSWHYYVGGGQMRLVLFVYRPTLKCVLCVALLNVGR